jgi:hypothetical protein
MQKRVGFLLVFLMSLTVSGRGYQFVEILSATGDVVNLRWGRDSMPVMYYFNRTPPKNFSLDQAIETTEASFDTWEEVETADLSVQFGGTTAAEPFVFFDFINTLGFVNDPELEGTGILGATNWVFLTFSGEIAESDIFFNDAAPWSVSENGTPGSFDYQATATHEIGHFFGLGHSASGVTETTGFRMIVQEGTANLYPFAFPRGSTLGRNLLPDDIAGISALYPGGGFTSQTGTLTGRVTQNGEPVFGAQVQAYNPFTDELIGVFTDMDGNYELKGAKSGPQVVRVNPITDPTSPEDYGFPEFLVDLDFRDELYEGRAEIVAGQTTSGVDFEVER